MFIAKFVVNPMVCKIKSFYKKSLKCDLKDQIQVALGRMEQLELRATTSINLSVNF